MRYAPSHGAVAIQRRLFEGPIQVFFRSSRATTVILFHFLRSYVSSVNGGRSSCRNKHCGASFDAAELLGNVERLGSGVDGSNPTAPGRGSRCAGQTNGYSPAELCNVGDVRSILSIVVSLGTHRLTRRRNGGWKVSKKSRYMMCLWRCALHAQRCRSSTARSFRAHPAPIPLPSHPRKPSSCTPMHPTLPIATSSSSKKLSKLRALCSRFDLTWEGPIRWAVSGASQH